MLRWMRVAAGSDVRQDLPENDRSYRRGFAGMPAQPTSRVRRDSLPPDVGQSKSNLAIAKFKKVIIVAADPSCGKTHPSQLNDG